MPATENAFISPQSIQTAYAVTSTANTDLDDAPTTVELLMTAGANGARVTRITSIPRATVTATNVQLYLSKDGGTTKRLLETILVAAHTVAATTEIPSYDWGFSEDNPLLLEAADALYVGQGVSTGSVVTTAHYGDY
ncbi:hypothetical protein [Phenylobacterium sp.]|uniref:hypothetical protein n=1 Tax=Phenylobacterium sp. TaxID=1871053 RepID=UPI0027300103|nr:hypothetical protein [Phenylobacterium sp.]MDP1873629.1 hypothetical protein [Phenylobacterium sp.]